MHKVAILGSSGLLGFGLTSFLSRNDFEVTEFNRDGNSRSSQIRGARIDVETFNSNQFIKDLEGIETVVNCIGMIKHRIQGNSQESLRLTSLVNGQFPKVLDELAVNNGLHIIQVGTDCVYSGADGNYDEYSPKDATDPYGSSKISGEESLKKTLLLRTSFIGREEKTQVEFLEWVLNHERNAEVSGFTNHLWNGVTVLQLARVISGIIRRDDVKLGVQHLVPKNFVSKFDLATQVASKFGRVDLLIKPTETPNSVDRRLKTAHQTENEQLWLDAGYPSSPTIEEMLDEYVTWIGSS